MLILRFDLTEACIGLGFIEFRVLLLMSAWFAGCALVGLAVTSVLLRTHGLGFRV